METFWISWWGAEDRMPDAAITDYWVTGTRADGIASICACVDAPFAFVAKRIVAQSFGLDGHRVDDAVNFGIEWRFCDAKPLGWRPTGERWEN